MPQDPSTQRTKAQRTMSETSVSKHRGTKVNEDPPQGRTKKRSSHTALSLGERVPEGTRAGEGSVRAGRVGARCYTLPMPISTPRVRELRHNQTEAERAAWHLLRGRRLGVKFRCQRRIENWVVDFNCIELTPHPALPLRGIATLSPGRGLESQFPPLDFRFFPWERPPQKKQPSPLGLAVSHI